MTSEGEEVRSCRSARRRRQGPARGDEVFNFQKVQLRIQKVRNYRETISVKNIWNSPKRATNNLSTQATYNSTVKLRLFIEL